MKAHIIDHLDNAETIYYGLFKTIFGDCFVAYGDGVIYELLFCDGDFNDLKSDLFHRQSRATFIEDNNTITDILNNLFFEQEGEVSIAIKGTSFQKKVWQALLKIPFGKTVSYSELAAISGNPKAIRATASAVARNPVSLIIPCHRIVRNDGTIGQYRWGKERKAAIIEWEKLHRLTTLNSL